MATLNDLLDQRGIKRADLVKEGIDKTTLSRQLKDNRTPAPENAKIYCKLLGMSLEEFYAAIGSLEKKKRAAAN